MLCRLLSIAHSITAICGRKPSSLSQTETKIGIETQPIDPLREDEGHPTAGSGRGGLPGEEGGSVRKINIGDLFFCSPTNRSESSGRNGGFLHNGSVLKRCQPLGITVADRRSDEASIDQLRLAGPCLVMKGALCPLPADAPALEAPGGARKRVKAVLPRSHGGEPGSGQRR